MDMDMDMAWHVACRVHTTEEVMVQADPSSVTRAMLSAKCSVLSAKC